MIVKSKFIEYMERYKNLFDENEKGKQISFEVYNELILDMMEELMLDWDSIVRYYIYSCDWGKDGEDAIRDYNMNRLYSITNLEELYDYIEGDNHRQGRTKW